MLWHWTDDLRAFSTADPGREGKWLGVNVLEARCFQSGLGPCNCAPVGLGASQTLSDLGGQRHWVAPATGPKRRGRITTIFFARLMAGSCWPASTPLTFRHGKRKLFYRPLTRSRGCMIASSKHK